MLHKFDSYAPINGVITNLPVRVGETVVPGIQNSSASTIMTIADMSLITAEVKVDETDIVSVQLNQKADISIVMETAPKEVLDRATIIARSAAKEGIIEALEKAICNL